MGSEGFGEGNGRKGGVGQWIQTGSAIWEAFSVCSSRSSPLPRAGESVGSLDLRMSTHRESSSPHSQASLTNLAFVVQVELHVLLWKPQSKKGISLEGRVVPAGSQ